MTLAHEEIFIITKLISLLDDSKHPPDSCVSIQSYCTPEFLFYPTTRGLVSFCLRSTKSKLPNQAWGAASSGRASLSCVVSRWLWLSVQLCKP